MKQLKAKLFNKVRDFLTEHGFKANQAQQAFYLSKPCGYLCLHLAFIRCVEGMEVAMDMAIRFNDVQDLLNEDNPDLPEESKKRQATLGCEVGNLTEGEPKRWTITKEEDISPVASQM